MLVYIGAGILGVFNMICWGVYGDLLIERFSIFKVLRSLSLGIFYGALLYLLNPGLPLFLVSLSVIALERITTEIYKFFIRKQGQRRYRLPDNLRSGKLVLRRLFGVFLVAILIAFLFGVDLSLPYWTLSLIAGFGYAIVGYAKDVAIEKMDWKKFLRSPVLAGISGVIIWQLFPGLPGKIFFLGVVGLERIGSGFYRKVLKKDLPTKFDGKKEDPVWQKNRKYLLMIYILDLICLGVLYFI